MDSTLFLRSRYLILLIAVFSLVSWQPVYAQTGDLLYGVTPGGPEGGFGVIFHLDPATDDQVVDYTFPYSITGEYNIGELIQADNGKYYGVSRYGGNGNKGVIFEWDPLTGSYTLMAHFNGANGSYPTGRLVQFNGKFYGYTANGGQQDIGAIYEWDPATGILQAKVHCTFSTGMWLEGYMTEYNGFLYGTTCYGGAYNKGVLFRYDPGADVYTILVEFDGFNGQVPNSALIVYNDKLIGTNRKGFGKIFEFDPLTNVYSIRASFDNSNGASPEGALTLLNDVFYGVTSGGGSANAGIVYEWNPANNVITNKYNFHTYPAGYEPNGCIVANNGILYGTMKNGGNSLNGTVFSFNPATEIYTDIYSFHASAGTVPMGGLVASNGLLYGTTSGGGYDGSGTIYEINTATNAFSLKVVTSNSLLGRGPKGSLTSYNGKLYGMTSKGGTFNFGIIFEWDPFTSTFTKKRDFCAETPGKYPMGSLTMLNNKFYGMTSEGGTYGKGVLFEWNPSTNAYLKLEDFNGDNGSTPTGNALTVYNNKLFGATTRGGAFDKGGIFEYDPVADTLINRVFFQTNGSYGMEGSLTLKDSVFYGMMHDGIFSWDPQTNQYSLLYQFTGLNGSRPVGNLTLVGDTFYATTKNGGTHNTGVLFSWNPVSNLYSKYHNYDTVCTPGRGSYPHGSMIQYSDNLYGMTNMCGTSGDGTIYKFNMTSGTYEVIIHFNGNNGRYPEYSHLTLFDGPVATKTIDQTSVHIYPNPVDDVLRIGSSNQQTGESDIIIYNSMAQIVVQQKHELSSEATINCGHLLPGLYILKITSGKGVIETTKFIKR